MQLISTELVLPNSFYDEITLKIFQVGTYLGNYQNGGLYRQKYLDHCASSVFWSAHRRFSGIFGVQIRKIKGKCTKILYCIFFYCDNQVTGLTVGGFSYCVTLYSILGLLSPDHLLSLSISLQEAQSPLFFHEADEKVKNSNSDIRNIKTDDLQ